MRQKKARYIILFAALAAGLFLYAKRPMQAYAGTDMDAPVVLELFTSQSCSSCPPADKLLGKLAEQDNIIALGCHVTYWDHLQWKDTLSRPVCTARQAQYNRTLGRGNSFTPQLIINGRYSMVGSNSFSIGSAFEKTKKEPIGKIGLSTSDDGLHITLPEKLDADNLILVTYRDDLTQPIESGENNGRTVSYTNPVDKMMRLPWDGIHKIIVIDTPEDAAHIAVLAQKKDSGPIIAAGKLDL